ncbi:RsmE family RNA methyltransferase [Haliangium sp.]|uniref:RsmE family RNA methyltransferase n=1 Tax=Haliangium sp. TaxID=2663208 RepID=UPI003D0FAA33
MSCRLFVLPERLVAGALAVRGADHHYLFRVRRLRPGARLTLFDGAGHEADAVVRAVGADEAELAVDLPRQVPIPAGCRLIVMPALIKGERMDFCVQKLVELGVAEIAPVRTARTVVKLSGERAARRRQRFLDIARDAARQSRRADVPAIHDIADLDVALARVAEVPLRLVAWTHERGRLLGEVLAAPIPAAACVLIGPEGGLAPDEIERAVDAGFVPVGLGPRVLRAETAAVAVAAAFSLLATNPPPP